MKKQHLLCIFLCIVLWSLCAYYTHNDILIPYPSSVLKSTINILSKLESYIYIVLTIFRVLKGYLLSLIIALLLTCITYKSDNIRTFFEPIIILIKTIPNISYIILAIIWLGSEESVSAVTFMIVFPILFTSFQNKLDNQKRKLNDVIDIYPTSFIETVKVIILPELSLEIIQTSITALSMGIKVAVMAEILAAVRVGVGKKLNYAKLNLNTTDMLAWTIIIIIISFLFQFLLNIILKQRLKKEGL